MLEGNPPIAVTLRRSGRAKRLSLRVSRLDGRVTLTLPPRAAEREGIKFLREREAWLRRHLAEVPEPVQLCIGGTVLFQGQATPIGLGRERGAGFDGSAITVPDDGKVGARVKALLKTYARDHLAAASDAYAAQLGCTYDRLSLRDTRSRWGSCSSKGVLMYSWRLIMAPPEVLQYVAAHEVAHLQEMNHSPAFWQLVEQLYPGHAPYRQWLRDNGDQLHRVQFAD